MSASKRTERTAKNASRARANRTRDWRPDFLAAFEQTGMVTKACEIAGVGRATVYQHREQDPEFATAWAELEELVIEEMEAEAYRRAVKGTVKEFTVTEDGEQIPIKVEYSDTLLIFLLKARRPSVYRENIKVQHTGPNDGPVKHELDIAVPAVRQHLDAALAAAQEAEGAARRD